MPAPQPQQLAKNELVIYLETNERIEAANLNRLLAAVTDFLHHPDQLGPDVFLELAEVRSGSLYAKWRAIREDASAIATIVAVPLAVAIALGQSMKEADGPVAESAACVIEEHAVVSAEIVNCGGTVIVHRYEMPAVERYLASRQPKEYRLEADPGHFDLTTGEAELIAQAPPQGFVGMFRQVDGAPFFQVPGGALYRIELAENLPRMEPGKLYAASASIHPGEGRPLMAVSSFDEVSATIIDRWTTNSSAEPSVTVKLDVAGRTFTVKATPSYFRQRFPNRAPSPMQSEDRLRTEIPDIVRIGTLKWINGETQHRDTVVLDEPPRKIG